MCFFFYLNAFSKRVIMVNFQEMEFVIVSYGGTASKIVIEGI